MYHSLHRSSARLPLLIAGFGLAWLLAGMLLIPPVIKQAHAGEGFAFLSGLFEAHPSRSLGFFLEQVQAVAVFGALAWWGLAGFAYLLQSPSTAQRIVGRATPGTLGAIRVLVCGTLLVSTLWENLPSSAALPREMIRPMGVMQLFGTLPGFDAFAASPVALGVFQWLTAGALLLGMVGWRTRWMLPVGAVCYLILGGLLRQYAWFYHTGLLALYLLVVLSLVPSQDGWSVDRLVRLWKGEPVPDADRPATRYGWARYALWATLALAYVAAGLSKLRNGGLFWWDATNFKYILFYSTLRPMEFDFEVSLWLASAPDYVFEALGLSALLGELFYGLVLFSKRARWIMPTVMLGMHLGILFLQNILFFDLILLQLIFFNLRPLRKAVARRLADRWGHVQLFYDGSSDWQARAVRVLGALDLFERVRLADPRAARAPVGRLPLPHAAYRGRTYRGTALLRLLSRNLPALWLVLPLLYVPGMAPTLARRFSEQDASATATPAPRAPAGMARAGSPRLTLTLAAVLTFCWVLRIEFYPFTGMQMFSKTRGPVVTYEIPLARLRSGAVVRAPIEASIGAMADSRYRNLLEQVFNEPETALPEAFLQTVVERWNHTAPPEQQIIEMEVQQWQWDFHAEPDDPNYGRLIARKVYPAPSAPTVRN